MAFPETLETLIEEGVIDGVRSRLMSGKEASVFVVERQGELLAAKVYKAREQRTFKATASYTEGRNQTRNSRDKRAMGKRSSYGKELIEESWRDVEARVLSEAFHAGVRVPKPFMLHDDVLLMELVVDEEGNPAPRLADFELAREVAERLHREIYEQVRLLLGCGKVHGDLSAFNILMARGGPTLIDMPQVVDAAFNNQAREILRRDLRNVTEHLARFDARLLRFRDCGDALWMHYVNGTLETATEPQEGGVGGGHHRSRRQRDAERGRMGRERPENSTFRSDAPARGPVGHGPGTPAQSAPRQAPPRDAPPRQGQPDYRPRGDAPPGRQGPPAPGARGEGPRQETPRDAQPRQAPPRDGSPQAPREAPPGREASREAAGSRGPREGAPRQGQPGYAPPRQDDGRRPGGPGYAPPREGGQRPGERGYGPPREGGQRPGGSGYGPPRDGGARPGGGGYGPREGGPRPEGAGYGAAREGGPRGSGYGPPRDGGARPGEAGSGPARGGGPRSSGYGPPRDGGSRSGGPGYGAAREGGPRPGGSGYGPPRDAPRDGGSRPRAPAPEQSRDAVQRPGSPSQSSPREAAPREGGSRSPHDSAAGDGPNRWSAPRNGPTNGEPRQ